ncbi:MAG TPA: tetratricopeptide repeat protein, partial [Polyangiaceae bacterium]|nr:tetratricopeptide repeat protein [Polyangiaceae bacterium]
SAEMAFALGRFAIAAGYLVWRLERGPQSDALEQKAEQAVRKSQQLNLPEHVLRRFPKVAQHAQLLARAERAAAASDAAAELAALEAAFELDAGLSGELLLRLLGLATAAAKLPLAERVLSVARGLTDLDPELLLQAARALARQFMEQRQPERALALLTEVGAAAPDDVALWSQALAAARAAGDDQSRQSILARLVDASGDAVKKSFWLNEAWELAKQRGDADLATKILRRWLSLDPEDTQALNRLEAEAMAAQNWEELAELLQRHLALGVSVRERRRLSLWRCELLETRLNRLAEARQELSALVERAPADRDLIERYAQLSEALGDAQEAAAAWLTASGLSSTRPVAAELAERACRLFLDAGEVMSARRVLAAPQTLPRTLGLAQLAVRLEREGENEPRLARALEELGAVTEQPVSERAGALLEASNLWRRLGDDERACGCASQAASLVPDDAEAQLLASYLEYRRGGPRSAGEARPTVERLRRVYDDLALDQFDLAGFLLAEALDVVEPGSGMPELTRVRERLGDTPLVSVGIGERLAKGPMPREALPHFDSALLGGDLRGLRKASQVALAAAQVALGSELLGLAHRYAKLAESDPELAEATRRLRDEMGRLVPKSMPPGARASRAPEARDSRPP